MGKVTGFLDYAREENKDVPVEERIKNFKEFHIPLTEEERRKQGARCMNCGVPFCQSGMKLAGMFTGCPLHNLCPEWNDEVYNGHVAHALSRLLKTNNFPEFTGRVCPALCEKACVEGLDDAPVTTHDNELYIIETAFQEGYMQPRIPEVRSGKRVAVIGAGPAGLAVACALNILLDLLFMGPMQLGAAGAALATVVAQAASVAFALVGIRKTRTFHKHARADHSAWWDPAMLQQILSIGLPIACQDGFIQISFLIITVIANRRGVDISAAVGIVEKTISFLFLVPSSMLSTVSTIAAQSIGAGDPARARQTLRYGVGIASGIGLLFATLFQFISAPFFTLFTKDPVVQALAVQYMCTYVFDCVVAGIHFPFSGFFSASGLSILSFIHNLCSVILVRIPGAWLATKLFPDSLYAMGLAAPAGSLLSALICIGFYIALRKKGRV